LCAAKCGRALTEIGSLNTKRLAPLEPVTIPSDQRFLSSQFYEQLAEHVFIAELLQQAWFGHRTAVEILRSEIDASGYDLVLEANGCMRHVQLKTSAIESRTARQNVNVALAEKASGCVVWILRTEDPTSHRMTLSYRFFGGEPGASLPSLEGFNVAKHTKGDASGVKKERPSIRVIPNGRFEVIADTETLLSRLFGL
jgi:hypothetical protein